MLLTFSLTAVYFVVTGIQFWCTAYLIKVIEADPNVVFMGFAIISITAPVCGAAIGSYLSDKNVS